MSDKLGFTFYPKDWWASDSFYDFTPHQRYIYLECIFLMYSNDGYMKTQKTQFENRVRINISDNDWEIVTQKFVIEGGLFTHISVNKRMRKTISNRINGAKGGRPKKNPKNPIPKPNQNPPSERERETKYNINWVGLVEQFNSITGKGTKVVPEKAKTQIKARLKDGYTKDDIVTAIHNCYKDQYHIETGHKYLTLEFISRADKMDKYSTINPNFKPKEQRL
jgi:uncharacterized phage protein (TIGR02220 family)